MTAREDEQAPAAKEEEQEADSVALVPQAPLSHEVIVISDDSDDDIDPDDIVVWRQKVASGWFSLLFRNLDVDAACRWCNVRMRRRPPRGR